MEVAAIRSQFLWCLSEPRGRLPTNGGCEGSCHPTQQPGVIRVIARVQPGKNDGNYFLLQVVCLRHRVSFAARVEKIHLYFNCY